jgi:hypothetical protein
VFLLVGEVHLLDRCSLAPLHPKAIGFTFHCPQQLVRPELGDDQDALRLLERMEAVQHEGVAELRRVPWRCVQICHLLTAESHEGVRSKARHAIHVEHGADGTVLSKPSVPHNGRYAAC